MPWMLLLLLASESPFAELEWRNIGPAVMGGRASDVEGVPGDPRIVYVGAASGGVWKTTDGGIEWKPVFDEQSVASIGDIALEPGNPSVLYVGTGESNLRNSVSFGNGVYKSTDGGESWRHLGLEGTRHISRIVIDPREPKRVYVGALGHAFGPNEERGVYRSLDGGESWERVLYIDDQHGISDLEIDPRNPNILYAAAWHFERKPWTLTSGSEGGGVLQVRRRWHDLEKTRRRSSEASRSHRCEGRAVGAAHRIRHCGVQRGNAIPIGGSRRDLLQSLGRRRNRLPRVLLRRPARRSDERESRLCDFGRAPRFHRRREELRAHLPIDAQ